MTVGDGIIAILGTTMTAIPDGVPQQKKMAYAYVSKAWEDEPVPGPSPTNNAWAFSILLLGNYKCYQLAYKNPPTTLVPPGQAISNTRHVAAVPIVGLGLSPRRLIDFIILQQYKDASRRAALPARRFTRRLHAMSSAVVVFAI